MALVPDQKFSTFNNGGDLIVGDIIVGLRGGLNTRFNYTGELPVGVIVPIANGGTGANNAVDARTNLGLGTMAIQNANAVTITGGVLQNVAISVSVASLIAGTVAAVPSVPTDIANKSYVDSLVAGSVASVSGTANRITSTGGINPVIDISGAYVGQASITTLGTIGTGTWQGTLVSLTYGGTGVSSVTIAPTASSFSGWDVNSNLSAKNHLSGFTTTVSAAGTTILTVASNYIQECTGATTQTYTLPVASTLAVGQSFFMINNASGNVTINSSGGNAVLVMAANTTALVTCVIASGTTAASWNTSYIFDSGAGVLSITGTANQIIASASTGNITLSLPQSISTVSSPTFAGLTLSSPLTVANGGTNKTSVTTAPAASSWAGWDANSNLSAKNHIEGFSTVATAAGTTVLTVASNYTQQFTGSTTQTVTMPVASTLVQGQSWQIINNSTGTVTVNSSGGNAIVTLSSNTAAIVTCVLTSGTTAASWTTSFTSSGSGSGIITNWIAYTPTFTSFGTVTNIEIYSRRVGNSLEIRGRFTGGTTVAAEARISLGYNGTNANVTSSNTTIVNIQQAGGGCNAYSYASTPVTMPLIEANVGYFTFGLQNSGVGLTKINGNNALLANNTMSFSCSIPVDLFP